MPKKEEKKCQCEPVCECEPCHCHEHHHECECGCGCDAHCDCGCQDGYECNCHDYDFDYEEEFNLPLIGEKAPQFTANTSNGPVNFPDDYTGKWVVFFSHPADFTPVCTTEFMTFASLQSEFKKLNTELIGLSVDSVFSHIAWLSKIKEYQYKEIKNVTPTFPVIDDLGLKVSRKYGMIHPEQSETSAVRAVFIIDPQGIVRTILYYPQSTGRNFSEIIRIIKSLQTCDKEQCATPADWQPGEDVIVPPAKTFAEAQKRKEQTAPEQYLDWFLCFKKTKSK